MKNFGMKVAVGVSKCREAQHSMRTRSGHCLQCKPANINYQNKNDTKKNLIFSISQELKLIHIQYHLLKMKIF